jgi:putative ABC transport system permease protein
MMAGGLTVGLLGALALMRLVHSQLFGIATVDPVVIGAAAAVFLVTSSAAVVLPAYRAATMDPMIALRQE